MSLMNECDRVRGVGILCCHCVRNIAYYRARWRNGELLAKGVDFWANANGNFLDIAVLEWCKVFADTRGKHYWQKVVSNHDNILEGLHFIAGDERAYDAYLKEMRTYRDKFVAHLDSERTMHIPTLTIALDTSIYLYEAVREEHVNHLSDAPTDLGTFYKERQSHARNKYPGAK